MRRAVAKCGKRTEKEKRKARECRAFVVFIVFCGVCSGQPIACRGMIAVKSRHRRKHAMPTRKATAEKKRLSLATPERGFERAVTMTPASAAAPRFVKKEVFS